MINKTVLKELDTKISLVLEKYNKLKEENERLQEIITASRETESKLRQEISTLKKADELKDLELEEIALRIGKTVGLNIQTEKVSIAS